MRKKKTKILPIFVIIFILTIIGFVGYYGVVKESVIGISPVPFEGDDGKVYWLVSSVGDSIDEGFSFNYRTGEEIKDYAKEDGTVIQPKKSMTVYFTKKDSGCEYTLIQETKRVLLIFDVSYHILSNPDRIANIRITDSEGQSTIIDGTIGGDTRTITDKDGKGELVIKALGFIPAKQDCPNYENVAIIKDGDDNKKIVYKSDYENKLNSISGGFVL